MWKRAETYQRHPRRLEDLLRLGRRALRVGLVARLRLRHGVPRERRARSATKYPEIPPVVATHKGFALPGLRPARRRAARRRPGRQGQPGRAFMIYHSGYDIFEYDGVPVGGDRRARTRATTRSTRRTARSTRSSSRCARTSGTPRSSSSPARRSATCRTCGPSSARSGASTMQRPQRGRAPARQADHPRRAQAHRVGHRQPLVRLAAAARSSRCAGCSSPTRPRSSTTCRTASTATSRTRRSRRRRPTRTIRNGILGRNAALGLQHRPRRAAPQARPATTINGLRETDYIDNARRRRSRRRRCASNTMHGARTRREVLKGLIEGPWTP